MKHSILISLGSNLGVCSKNLKNAIALMDSRPELRVERASEIYLTEPQDCKDQPWFCNQVAMLSGTADLTARALLKILKGIESQLGREKCSIFKGPRIIDLDILDFDGQVHNDQKLVLPHPGMKHRAFVLVPLRQIRPEYVFPDGVTIDDALSAINCRVNGNKIFQS
ncbi:MAG: 2-amino-4-hydroxy-6-hydroxymethyldihydropteridine diphosphokinase [Desulfonatronovibrionaceae bacterium]